MLYPTVPERNCIHSFVQFPIRNAASTPWSNATLSFTGRGRSPFLLEAPLVYAILNRLNHFMISNTYEPGALFSPLAQIGHNRYTVYHTSWAYSKSYIMRYNTIQATLLR
jgi:hypothetical protein